MRDDVVREWLHTVDRDLQGAVNCVSADEPTPGHGAFFVQQAAEKLVKSAMVAEGRRPPHTHDIRRLGESLSDDRLKGVFADLARFSKYAIAFRYPGEERDALPDVQEVAAWIFEVRELKAERWLAEQGGKRSSGPEGGSAKETD